MNTTTDIPVYSNASEDILNSYLNVTSAPDQNIPMVNPLLQYSSMIRATYAVMVLRSFGLFVVGFMGSIITLIVLNRAELPENGMYQYMATIAVCDCVHQLVNCLYQIMIFLSFCVAWFCRIGQFVAYVSTFTSDAVVMVVAIDRAIAVIVPHKAKALSTPGRARITIGLVFLFECLESMQAFWTWDESPDLMFCIRDLYYISVFQAFAYLALVRTSIIFCVLLVSSTLIIYQLRKQRQMMASWREDADDDAKEATKKETQIAVMLVSISALFIVTTMPYLLLKLSNSIFGWTTYGMYYAILYNLLGSIASFLKSANHALNFFMYILSAQFFRNEVKKLFCGPKHIENTGSNSDETRNTSA